MALLVEAEMQSIGSGRRDAVESAAQAVALVAALEQALCSARACTALGRRGQPAAANMARVRAHLEQAEALMASRARPGCAVPWSQLPARLTDREAEILQLVALGRSNREMAAALSRSERTVERHLENLYRKIGARNRADATAFALRRHLA